MTLELDRRQFLQLAGANAAALALGPIGAAAPGRSEKVGQTQTDIELFDVQCGFGGMTPGDPKVVSVEELLAEMARLHIGTALVHTAPEDHENDAPAANEAINAACKSNPSLVRCPIVMPGNCGGLRDEMEQVAAHVKQGCGAVIVRPSVDYWTTAPCACGALFGTMRPPMSGASQFFSTLSVRTISSPKSAKSRGATPTPPFSWPISAR